MIASEKMYNIIFIGVIYINIKLNMLYGIQFNVDLLVHSSISLSKFEYQTFSNNLIY